MCNYLDVLAFARAQLADPTGHPLSMRLLNETHRRLMRGVRGAEELPGQVRRSACTRTTRVGTDLDRAPR